MKPMERRQYLLKTWAAAVVLAAALGCGDEPKPQGRPPKPKGPPKFNVLLITLDTTRADRLGCYGYAKAETPALDALAARGVRFENAFTHVPLTLPSHATILTGLLPPEHGLHDNGRGKLGPGPVTLAEVFREHGARTAAFLASFVLDKQFGLARGFEVYDDRMNPPPQGGPNVFHQENPANVVSDRALAWLRKHAKERFFCWVHFFDPHLPYEPPEPYKSRHADPYDGEVAFMDAHVKRLLDFLDEHRLREQTLVVVCGDHGEAFGEHREHGHGPLVYETTMRVPLLLSLPKQIPEGHIERGVAGLVDVAPTVFDVLGWTAADPMSGRSLPASDAAPRPCYGESEFLLNSYGWAPLRSLTTKQWKYILCPEPELYDRLADPNERQDLAAAKPEIAADMNARLEALRKAMKEGKAVTIQLDPQALAALKQLGYLSGTSVKPPQVDPARRKDPKAMMRIYNATEQAQALIDAKRFREAAELLRPLVPRSPESLEIRKLLAHAYMSLNMLAEARPHVEAYLAGHPDDRPALAYLGEVCLEEGRLDDAVKLFRHTLRLPQGPLEPFSKKGVSETTLNLRTNLGVALGKLGKVEQAVRQYELVLANDPTNFQAHANLAGIRRKQERHGEAIKHFRAALAQKPEQADLHAGLGAALVAAGKPDEGIAEYRRALQINPRFAEVHSKLGGALQRGGQQDLALFHVSEAARLRPRSHEVHTQLGDLYVELKRRTDAVKAFRRASAAARAVGAFDAAKALDERIRQLTVNGDR